MTEESFRSFYDDPLHPENYHLKIYENDEDKNQSQYDNHKLNEIQFHYFQRTMNYYKYIKERILWIKNQTKQELSKKNELRENIRVLIILGSAIENQRVMCKKYIKHNEDTVTTLLIAHLFQYACGIPGEQIMITSSNPANFPCESKIILPSAYGSKGHDINMAQLDPNHIKNFKYSNNTEFKFFDTVFSQVGEDQYHFLPDDFLPIIYPFNKYFLNKFKTDENSELFVFFIDHRTNGYFKDNYYELYIEHLMEIKSKNMFVFNISCYSGLLIDLIHISDNILELHKSKRIDKSPRDIFNMLIKASHPLEEKDVSTSCSEQTDDSDESSSYEEIDESTLFNQIDDPLKKTISNADRSENEVKEQEKTQKEIEKERIINEILNILVKELNDKNDIEQKIRLLVDHMSIYDSQLSIDPLLFHRFKEKAFILCSCPLDQISPSLPIRDFYIGNNETISSHGNVFSSIIIECLFHPQKADTNVNHFISHVQSLHNNMKLHFCDILKQQFNYSDSLNPFEQVLNEVLNKTYKRISIKTVKNYCDQYLKFLDSFFKIDYSHDGTYSCPTGLEFPDMQTILLPEKYWNIDVSKVDPNEYSNLKIYDYNYLDYVETLSPEGYGPIKGVNNLIKLANDFFNCLESEIRHFMPSYKINCKMKHLFENKAYSDATINEFKDIKEDICHLFVPNTVRAFQKLEKFIKYQLEYDFKKAHRLYHYCCVKTLKKILPLFRPIDFT